MDQPHVASVKDFPDELFITFDEDEGSVDGGYLLTSRTMAEAVTETKRTMVATYKRVKVNEAKLSVDILTEVG